MDFRTHMMTRSIVVHQRMKGSTTVELSYIMPVIFFVFLVVIYIGFYFHDKSVMQGLVYEASIIGTSDFRNSGEVDEERIQSFLEERGALRLLFFPEPVTEIQVTDALLSIHVESKNGAMRMKVGKVFPLVAVEKNIRKVMRIEETVGGMLDGSEK